MNPRSRLFGLGVLGIALASSSLSAVGDTEVLQVRRIVNDPPEPEHKDTNPQRPSVRQIVKAPTQSREKARRLRQLARLQDRQ
jgi:hypothetical protein